MPRAWALAPTAIALASCGLEPYSTECPDEPIAIGAPLHRLSVDDYERTLRVLFGSSAVDDVAALLAGLPPDLAAEEGAFARQDQGLTQRHVDQFYAVSDALAQRAAADGAVRAVAGQACADSVTDDCLTQFVPTFLERALRRPPTQEELDAAWELVGAYTGTDQVHALVFLTLMKPEVLYHFENQGQEARDGTVTLTDHELANRLAYHFWGAPPDQALLDAAADGSLATEAGLAMQVDRMFDDPRTQHTLDDFIVEWLHLERGDYAASPRLDVLAPDLELEGLYDEMRDESLDLVHHAMSNGESWHYALTTTDSFARTERLAALYGVPVWDGVSDPPVLPAEERAGLLTRAAVLATADGSTNPFRRGAFVRRLMLCEGVPAPPATLPPDALTPPDAEPGATSRERFAAKVVSSECAGCHALFSDLGYSLEAYDGLGRYRTEEHLVTSQGEDLGFTPVDVAVETDIGGVTVPLSDPVAMSWAIADSVDANLCLSRQYFRFSQRREEAGFDTCRIDDWASHLQEGESLGEWMKRVALDPTFRQRRLED